MFNKRKLIIAVELGTSMIRVCVGEPDEDNEITILKFAEKPSTDVIVKGEIVDVERALEILNEILTEIEEDFNIIITKEQVFLAITGDFINIRNEVGRGRNHNEDNIIRDEHIEEILREINYVSSFQNQTILNSFDSFYTIDKQKQVYNPRGQKGRELDAHYHLVLGDTNRIDNFTNLLSEAGFEPDTITKVFSGIASVYGTITDEEKENGVLLIDMGAGTTEFVVICKLGVFHSGVFPIGCEHIINDIHIGIDITYKQAEKLLTQGKLERVLKQGLSDITFDATSFGKARKIPANSVEQIIRLRLEELFGLIKKQLEEHSLLHNINSGIVFSGGGTLIPNSSKILNHTFNAPIRIGLPTEINGAVTELSSARYTTICGLLKFGKESIDVDAVSNNMFIKAKSFAKNILEKYTN